MSDKRDQARSRWMQMFENIYSKYESLFRYGTELVVADAETLKTYGEDGKEYTLQVAPWEVGEEQNGTYIRDGRLMHDLVYRGEAEVDIPTNTPTALISRQAAIEEIALHDPTNGTEPYFSGHEVIDILKCVPPVTHAKRTETHGVCSDCISRQAAIECCSCLHPEDCWAEIKALPPVEPKRPKTTETMMVDGEPIEIDPLSYEVGYTHGQFSERPKGEWTYLHGSIGSYMTISCPFCGNTFNDVAEWEYNFCPKCGSRMKGADNEQVDRR